MSNDAVENATLSEVEPLQGGSDIFSHGNQLVLPINHVDNNDELELASASYEHEKISQKSQKLLTRAVWVLLSFWITYSMRSNLIILYAETFYNNTAVISGIVYLSYVSAAISCLIYGIVADKWRVDYLLIIASIFDVITFWMEATAPIFIVLAIAYSIGGQPFSVIALSFNLKLIPTYYAQQIRGKMLQMYAVSSIIGPVIGGIICYFYDYRTVFYCSATISIFLFVYTIIFFFNVEKALLNEQLAMKEHYDKVANWINTHNNKIEDKYKWIISRDYRFPVCLENEKVGSLFEMGTYRAVLLSLFSMHGVLIGSIDFIIIPFYVWYIKHRFDNNINIIISTAQLSSYAVAYIIGSQTSKKLAKFMQSQKIVNETTNNYNNKKNNIGRMRYNFENLIVVMCLFCLVIMLICSLIMLPLDIFNFGNDSIEIIIQYWITIFIYGIVVGMGYLNIELVCVELIPNDVAGKITGIQMVIRRIIGGTLCLIVGILFDLSINYFWYIQAACQIVSLFIIVLVASLESLQWYHL